MLERLTRLNNVASIPKVKVQTPASFFEKLEKEGKDLLTWNGELYLELHRGTYTSQAKNKLFNRQSEWLLRRVEFLSTIAHLTSPSGFRFRLFLSIPSSLFPLPRRFKKKEQKKEQKKKNKKKKKTKNKK